jgi:hypothetical protein
MVIDYCCAGLEPVGKWYTGPVRPVNGPVGIICPTGEIPAKTGEKVTNFLENNF